MRLLLSPKCRHASRSDVLNALPFSSGGRAKEQPDGLVLRPHANLYLLFREVPSTIDKTSQKMAYFRKMILCRKTLPLCSITFPKGEEKIKKIMLAQKGPT